jgi:cytidylate kinase
MASQLASEPRIRDAVLAAQRRARRPPGLVADGRDMGTVVFPDATLKIFLTATPQVRAQRRYKQLKLKGFDVNLAHLFQVIQDRDARDAQRRASPLVPADDAVTLDTSDLEGFIAT